MNAIGLYQTYIYIKIKQSKINQTKPKIIFIVENNGLFILSVVYLELFWLFSKSTTFASGFEVEQDINKEMIKVIGTILFIS